MLDWLLGWFGQWVPSVGQTIVNMVHGAVRAVTSWAGHIFGNVGDAWSDLWNAHGSLLAGLDHFAWRVWRHFTAIMRHDFPTLWRYLTWLYNLVIHLWHWLYRQLHREIAALTAWERRVWHDTVTWVKRDIWAPLKRRADLIWHDLIKWGYLAWWYITHPDKLAGLIGWALTSWLEQNAWSVAGHLGGFIVALVTRNLRRVSLLIEDVIHSAL